MFVPVACSQCGKPFQVPEASVGNPTVCPWCQATVSALPVGKPAPGEHRGLTPPARSEPEPLPLDDATAPERPFPWWVVGVGVVALVAAAGVTVAVLRYERERAHTVAWKAFTPPDGSFAIDLFDRVTEESEKSARGKRFVSEQTRAGVTAWVGWVDLDASQVQLAADKDAWQHFLKTFDTERDRLKAKYRGTVTAEKTLKFADPLTRELRLDYDGGRLVERMLVVSKGPHPRAYFAGLAGRIDPDGSDARHLFESFRVSE